ncbi:MAG: FtsX-like permease family protein [Terrisporobacter sp.]
MKLENNNKNIIKRITNSSLKSNKGRNIFAVLAIVLTTFMISSVFSIGVSFIKNYQTMSVRMEGSTANVFLPNPKEDQIKAIENLGISNSIGEEIIVGQITSKDIEKNKAKIFLKYYDKESWEKQITPGIGDVKGDYPVEENEVMMSQKSLELLGKEKAKIGDSIEVSYNDAKGNTIKKDFILSGTYRTYGFIVDTGYLLVSEKYIKNNDLSVSDNGMLSLALKNNKKNEAPDLLKSEVNLNKTQKFEYNYDVNSDSQEVTMISVGTIGMIGLFIVLSGYLLIYNIMYIAVTKDIHFYGLMKTIGTSPKQIKKIVKGQAFRLSIIGIPIGLILGAIVSFALVPMAMSTFSSGTYANAMPSNISFNPLIFIGATLFSLFTVSLSCRKPAKIASSISPTEALRYSGTKVKKQSKDRRSTKGGKLYKMAWYNVFRDKKRAILVFMSLFMGIMTYLSVNTFLDSMSVDNYIDRYMNNDFEIQNIEAIDGKINDKFIKEIRNIDGVKTISNFEISNIQMDMNEKLILPSLKGAYERFGESEEDLQSFLDNIKNDPSTLSPLVIGVDDLSIERFNEKNKVKIDVEAFKSGKLALLDDWYYSEEDKNIKAENITLRGQNNKAITFKGDIFTNESHLLPDGPSSLLGVPTIYISSSQLKKLDENPIGYLLHINVDEKYEGAINSKLNKITASKGLFIESRSEKTKEFNNSSMVMNIIGGGMSIILILIGLLNFINVMITGINVRLKELAVMESIGMTKKQIKKMLTFEGLYYGGITTLLVSTLGMGIVFMIGEMTKMMADYAKFVFPTVPLISLTILIFAVCLITPGVVYKYSSKRSVTERLREIEK